MIGPRHMPLVLKQVWRQRTRSLLTVLGVAVAMFLFASVQAMDRGVTRATSATRADTVLVVYRENRYCPFSSRLPEHYLQRIARLPGVASVVPMKIVVNNCRASLDVITFRGVPAEGFRQYARAMTFLDGSFEKFEARGDAAVIGEALARRRGFRVGDGFDAAGITVNVAGIIRSDEPQDENVAYVHLGFLQRANERNQEGIVTQFNVRVTDAALLPQVARAIDEEFQDDQDPTHTRTEKAFVEAAARDVVEIVRFTRWLGWGCLAAVLALVGNAIVLSVQDRVKEHAIMQTLGFGRGLLARLIVAEGLVLGLIGGSLGTAGACALLWLRPVSFSTEGINLTVSAPPGLLAAGVVGSAVLGALAGLVPAWQASRREIAACFRAV
ncbi:MAG TPA: ABC transporter permease [Phycisphaerales bacterium]|nr:ABC transporter permease [Phycisphaerales bacterium]